MGGAQKSYLNLAIHFFFFLALNEEDFSSARVIMLRMLQLPV